MLDEQWLNTLDFVGRDGIRIKGLLGVGSEQVALHAIAPDGTALAVKTYKHHLGYHIREVPMILSGMPLYDINRLNNKLFGLLKAPYLDEITCEYDRVFASVLSIVYGGGEGSRMTEESVYVLASLLPLLGRGIVPYCPEAFHFILCTPAITRRLQEIASLPPYDDNDPLTMFARVNGPNFPIEGMRDAVVNWAERMLKVQAAAKPSAPFEPDSLSQNPLFVWGAAVMDGFITDEEIPTVVDFIQSQFGRLPSHARVGVIFEQIVAVTHLLANVLKESEVHRLVRLCGKLGFMFDVRSRDGKVVASSMSLDAVR